MFPMRYDIILMIDLEKFQAARPTVMMFHGNGGNMGHRVPLAKIFYLRMRCNVMMVSYRGCVVFLATTYASSD